jgi:valyl-tRNA synthetase
MASESKSDPGSKNLSNKLTNELTNELKPGAPLPPTALGKSFEPGLFEKKIYAFWEERGCFEASDENAPGQKAFSIMIPPPNVTGVLHMGHALTNTIQDILVRWRRMRGDNALWLPGTDHAGIATQAQVEKQIAKEGKNSEGRPLTRHDLGREKFLERTWKWKEEHASQIRNQLKRLGSSLDWSRERFTMDEGLSRAVREVFVSLHEKGLIYRGERIINWCVRCRTALSDLEVIPTERKGNFWHLRYRIVERDGTPVLAPDGSKAELVIATTRPETLLGDTAVAIHPEDERYRHLHGKFAVLPLVGRQLPIVLDTYVDREFGSGALKVTPAHDFNDYDLGLRHGLPLVSVMGADGRLSAEAGALYAGLKFTAPAGQQSEARARVLADLEAQGLLVRTEPHSHKVGLCQRCDTVAEPIVSKQWFVRIEPLARPAIEAVESGKIRFSPPNWEKTYFEWMRNIRDWCISRQLWWGHQIPAWYCPAGHVTVVRSAPGSCGSCGSAELTQDPDVLDTWFSSALWPFSTLGWPEKTAALRTFYPNSVMETGFDIIFFWVARMIMMGLHFLGEVPFHKVYLHAMVRDEKGEKMSKSKGNVIDPLVVIDQHGADPLRFTLAAMAGQGRDIKLSVDRVEGYRAFCNKLWNAVKFFHLQLDPASGGAPLARPENGAEAWLLARRAALLPLNRWILSRLQAVTAEVERGFSEFELNHSAQALYEFAWNELCDWYIEFAKLPLRAGGAEREETVITLHHVLEKLLALLHPIMPFVTEELWGSLPWVEAATTPARDRAGREPVCTLMFQRFPESDARFVDAGAEETLAGLRAVVGAIRNFRGENNIPPRTEFEAFYQAQDAAAGRLLESFSAEIRTLARLSALVPRAANADKNTEGQPEAVVVLGNPALELRIPLRGLVDVEEEGKRLRKERERAQADLEFVRGKLCKESFMAKAPAELVRKERAREAELVAKVQELEAALERLVRLA